jgi:tetrahydromethanopterin S-methyltransferase subunit G
MARATDIDALSRRVSELEERVKAQAPASTFKNFIDMITRIGAAIGVLAAAVGALAWVVHFSDRLPK